MTVLTRTTHICATSERNAWGKPAEIVEIAANNRLILARVIIAGRTLAVFDNMFDPWDLIEEGQETLDDLKADKRFCFIHKSGAVVSNSLQSQGVE
jgi:hypothetical protein